MAEAMPNTPGLQDLPDSPNSWRRRLEVPEMVHYVDSFETPFYTFTSKAVKGKRKVDDYKVYSREKRPIPTIAYVKVASTWNGGSMTFTPSKTSGGAADASYWYENLTVKFSNPSRRVAARVTDVDYTLNQVTITAITASPATPSANDLITFMAPAYMDGDVAGTVISKNTERDYFLTQIMRMPIEVTARMAAARLHGPTALALMKRDAIRSWKRLVEAQFLIGERYEDTTGTHEVTTTEGMVSWLLRVSSQSPGTGSNPDVPIIAAAALASVHYDNFVGYLEQLFRFRSSEEKYFFCSRAVLARLNKIAFMSDGTNVVGRFNFETRKNEFGITIQTLRTSFGTAHFLESGVLTGNNVAGDGYDKTMVVVDPMGINQIVLQDVHWKNIVKADGAAVEGSQEMYGDLGLEMTMPECHGLVIFS